MENNNKNVVFIGSLILVGGIALWAVLWLEEQCLTF